MATKLEADAIKKTKAEYTKAYRANRRSGDALKTARQHLKFNGITVWDMEDFERQVVVDFENSELRSVLRRAKAV